MGGITSLGAENVPKSGPVIFCPNHISDSDAAALYATSPRRDIFFMARHELFQTPILGPFLKAYGGIPIKRDSSDRAAIKIAIEKVSSGASLVIFPEGRLSQDGEIQRIQPGAALIAIKSNATIVPVALHRTNWFLPYSDLIPKPSRLPARVIFGKPICSCEVRDLHGRRAVDLLNERIEGEIRKMIGQR
jgi:1-acyl-sn-glycerol-3-phosphate acyltransferase